MNIYEIIMAVMCVSFFLTLLYIVFKEPDYDDHPVHHDHLKSSFYSIAHQVKRDEKKRY